MVAGADPYHKILGLTGQRQGPKNHKHYIALESTRGQCLEEEQEQEQSLVGVAITYIYTQSWRAVSGNRGKQDPLAICQGNPKTQLGYQIVVEIEILNSPHECRTF